MKTSKLAIKKRVMVNYVRKGNVAGNTTMTTTEPTTGSIIPTIFGWGMKNE